VKWGEHSHHSVWLRAREPEREGPRLCSQQCSRRAVGFSFTSIDTGVKPDTEDFSYYFLEEKKVSRQRQTSMEKWKRKKAVPVSFSANG